MVKILLLVDDYLPSTKSAPLMMHQLATELHRRGHAVFLATPSQTLATPVEADTCNGFTVIRFSAGRFKNTGRIRRAINELLFSRRLLRAIKKIPALDRVDLIVYYSPSIFWGTAVSRLKKRWHCPSYLILRDIFPQWCVDSGILSAHSPICGFFRYFERINYDAADRIGVQSPGNLAYFDSRRYVRDKVEVLYNWFDCGDSLPVPGGYREKLHLEGKIIYFYGGNIGNAQDMMNIVRLARNMISRPEAHFLLVGAGDEYSLVEEEKRKFGLHNMTLLEAVDQKEYFSLLAEIDVGMLTLNPMHKTQNFPGKLLGYMFCAKPILGSINSGNDTIEIINNAGAGLISVNPDDRSFQENAEAFLDPDRRRNAGIRARDLLERQFSVTAAADHLMAFGQALCKSPSDTPK